MHASQPINETLHLQDYINVVRHRRDVVTLFFATVVLVVAIGSFVMMPIYRATAVLLIDVESPNVLTTSGTVALESQNYYSYKEYYQSQIEIITSEALIRKVFDEFGLGKMREYAKAREPIKKFIKTIRVEPVRDTRLFRLNVDNRDPEVARKIANRLAEIYVKRNLAYISKNELLNLLKNEYLKLETRLSEYTKVYKEDHPEMIRLRKEMSELVTKIEREKESAITYDIGDMESKTEYRHTLEGLKANNVSILTLAETPRIPIKPKKLLNIIIAIVVGLVGGTALAFFFEYMDNTVKDVEEIERMTHWPILGNVPTIDASGKMAEGEKDLYVHIRPKDPISEMYRSIRTSILFSATEEHPIDSIIVTSPGPQEGKTLMLCNLGIAMAQNQKRVLLVDADMRRPRLHEAFKIHNETGLSDFLSGQAPFDKLVQKTEIEGLSIVSGGPHPPNPSELLASVRMKEFIKTAKEKFNFIIFDTPPSAILTDAIILSRAVDGTVMVIESGKTERKLLSRVCRLFADSRVYVIGVLLNKIRIKSSEYGYYSYYYGKLD
ncbi:MAG: polysaccharide biosynthesis tyrosine autokinase [Candidatus Omnitrophota bacterium]